MSSGGASEPSSAASRYSRLVATVRSVFVVGLGSGMTANYQSDLAKVSVVGVGMRVHTGVAQRMFKALADAKVNIQNITTSEIKISVLDIRAGLGDVADDAFAGRAAFADTSTTAGTHTGTIKDPGWTRLRLKMRPRGGRSAAVATSLSANGTSFNVRRLH